ncbi:hypothetical protein Tsubulata_024479 [Turnera subulata]|uniref:Transmembrane protein n=1 Tax=Turnera subulata TaxID=218843 RepID=A0A9Q0JAZ1_9ROSI|nr:hypothetical protein Tsubulata_024479 [Turnera subulata]
MAKALKLFSFLFILFLVSISSTTQARPFNILKSDVPRIKDKGFFDGLALGAIKQSGPSPGAGNSNLFGGIKDGPSPGTGH